MRTRDLNKYRDVFSLYTELRWQENRENRITLLNGEVAANTQTATGGVSARTYKDGQWGFAATPQADDEGIKRVLSKATENASFLAQHKERKGKRKAAAQAAPRQLPQNPSQTESDFSGRENGKNKEKGGQKELIEFFREVDDYIAKKYPSITTRTIRFYSLEREQSVFTSDGSLFSSLVPITYPIVSLGTEKGGDKTDLSKIYAVLGEFENLYKSPSECFVDMDALAENLMKKTQGTLPRAGYHEVVMDSNLAGILAHEAIGHPTEADLALAGSVAADALGRQIASPLVSLVDFAHTALGEGCLMPVYTDDEGSKAEDVTIIEKGILKGFMHNKETAALMGHELTGNARAWGFDDEPLIRMRNTAILPGTSKLEEMIASVEDGYYLMSSLNGQADTTSEFMFAVSMGYEIKNGQLGRAIKDTTISGVAFDMLKTISMISDDMFWSFGLCGKGQMMPVSAGGPAIKCRVHLGGR